MNSRIALVTGSGRGLGLAISRTLLDRGYAVALFDNVAERLPSAVASLNVGADQVIAHVGDLTKPDDVDRAVSGTVAKWGQIDLLVNNAAISAAEPTRAEDIEFNYWKLQLDVNVNGTFLMSQRVARSMIKRGQGGAIVNISSIYSMRSLDWRLYLSASRFDDAPYHVSKGAVDQLTKSLAVSWSEFGIRVNSVNPGPIDNQGTREAMTKDEIDSVASRVPMRRMASEEEIANVVAFLASPEASYMTGANVLVDGGWTCL